ncbi:MAG TPA: hypothetical protein VMM58_10375 [Bacteroidota bacterium]|nr:hypothetical protein [Bacteroidota bacterium]
MVTLFVFYLHTVGAVYAFTEQYQEEGLGAGTLAVAFMGIIFSVGWSISTFFLKFLIKEEGFGMYFNRDAMSLALLTIGEGFFYYYYLRGSKKKGSTSAQS